MKNRARKYVLFSILFWMIAGYLMVRSFRVGCGLFGGSDAVSQHYPAMLYISRYVREWLRCIFTGRKMEESLYNWSLGFGDNIIAVLNYYGFGDPFYLLSAFFSEKAMPYFYSFLFLFRVYLGGIFQMLFFESLQRKKLPQSDIAYVVSALVYVFSGFTFQSNIHIIFVHAIMYIPMLLWAARLHMDGKRGRLVAATALFSLSGFFFFYIGTICLIVFVLEQLVMERSGFKKSLIEIGKMILEYLEGICFAAFIVVPSTMGYLASDRVTNLWIAWGFYPISFLRAYVKSIFLATNFMNEQTFSICGIGILAFLWIIFSRRYWKEKIFSLLILASLCMPLTTMIMSGGAAYDRWHILAILWVSYLVFLMWDESKRLSLVQKGVTFFFVLGLAYIWKKKDYWDNPHYQIVLMELGVILLFTVVLFPMLRRWTNKRIFQTAEVLCLLIFTVIVGRSYSLIGRDYPIEAVRNENIVKELIPDEDSFYRIDYGKIMEEPRIAINAPLSLQYPGISYYFSLENSDFIQAMSDWDVNTATHNQKGLDERSVLETLSAVKYYIGSAHEPERFPASFKKKKESEDGEWILYENPFSLELVYGYDKVYAEEDFQRLNAIEKQEVMLEAAVVSQSLDGIEVKEKTDDCFTKEKWKIVALKNAAISDKQLFVKDGDIVYVSVRFQEGDENYLDVVGQQVPVRVQRKQNTIKIREPITLGQANQEHEEIIQVQFPYETQVALKDLVIWHYDLSKLQTEVEKRREGIEQVAVQANQIYARVTNEQTKLMCIAVPYDQGWSAWVDGEKVRIVKTNSLFMGILVGEGEHEIQLRFIPAGWKQGVWISSITGVLLVLQIILWIKKRKNEQATKK